jgi:hypothetical protein
VEGQKWENRETSENGEINGRYLKHHFLMEPRSPIVGRKVDKISVEKIELPRSQMQSSRELSLRLREILKLLERAASFIRPSPNPLLPFSAKAISFNEKGSNHPRVR